MIDTIVLMLQHPDFSIGNHDRFSPSTKGLFRPPYYSLGGRGNFSCYQNPTAEEFKKGVYKPRLTVTKRPAKGGYAVVLRIEFSIPKLLFGNNFDEVSESNFAQVVDKLLARLREMDVILPRHVLETAPVSAIHYSKNIPLTDHSTPYGILKEIAKINLTQALDLNQTDFRNEGHCLKFHANSYELAFYDKMKDLRKAKTSEKRTVEKSYAIQLDLFEDLEPKKPFEVLRMEARLNKREVIKRFLKKAGVGCELTFAELFKKDISQKILSSFIETIENGYALVAYQPKTSKEFIASFRINQPKAGIYKMLKIHSLQSMINEMGVRGFREAIKSYGKHHWPRLRKDLAACKYRTGFTAIGPVIKANANFAPLKLADFTEKKKLAK